MRGDVKRFLGSVRRMNRRAEALALKRQEALIELRDPGVPALGADGGRRTNVPSDPMRKYDNLIDKLTDLDLDIAQLRADIIVRSVIIERVLRLVPLQQDARRAALCYYASAMSMKETAAACGCGERKVYYLLQEAAGFVAAAAEEDIAIWDIIERELRKEE